MSVGWPSPLARAAVGMEAVGMEATDDVSLVVKAVVSPGYSWHGERVLTKTQVEVEPEA